jgi:hypothetical protein
MSRKAIGLRTKLASALLQMLRPNGDGTFARIIPHEHAKLMSDEQIISLFHFDHYPIPHAHGGPDEAWNLDPLPIAEHRNKTRVADIPAIAKSKRIRERSMGIKRTSRPLAGTRASGLRKRMNGNVERWPP